jgi:electron transfer flavoprotein beta subunit
VVSTEGAAAPLRRAPLRRVREGVEVERVAVGAAAPERQPVVVSTSPWRPRPRELPAPEHPDPRLRIVALTGALVERTPPRRVELDPEAAASAILDQLRAWGYLPPAPS